MAVLKEKFPDKSVNTVIFSELVDLEKEPKYLINKRSMILTALNFPGCFNAELLAPVPNIREEWLTFVQFDNEACLNSWLKSEEYNQSILQLNPYIKSSQMQFLPHWDRQVSYLITTTVTLENEENYLKWNKKIERKMSTFPGFLRKEIKQSKVRSEEKNKKIWVVIFQFKNQESLKNWLNSDVRRNLIEEGAKFYQSSVVKEFPSGFGNWFNLKQKKAVVSSWKMPFIVEMALYPLVLIQSHLTFLNEIFLFPVVMLINTFYGCFLLQYLLIPLIQKLMNFWIYPQNNQNFKNNIIGIFLAVTYLLLICYITQV